MKHRVKESVVASFVGDALSLGVHWVYNTRVIDRTHGQVQGYLKPALASFHQGKEKGAFTHYGDQMLLLLASLAEKERFDVAAFSHAWLQFMNAGSCYLDKASKETMENLKSGVALDNAGSGSTDLGGAARIAPLLLLGYETSDELMRAATVQTALTHKNQAVMDAAAFFACTASLVLDGCRPVEAMGFAVDEAHGGPELREAVTMGFESVGKRTRETIAEFGQMCAIEAALPGTIHLIARYENNLQDALIENVMAGGDSAARGMLAGLVLGAYRGIETIPARWLDEMIHYQEICRYMDRVLSSW